MSGDRRRGPLATFILDTMSQRHITQTQLATALGLSQSEVSRRLWGRIPWRVHELNAIADALEIPRFRVLIVATEEEPPEGR